MATGSDQGAWFVDITRADQVREDEDPVVPEADDDRVGPGSQPIAPANHSSASEKGVKLVCSS